MAEALVGLLEEAHETMLLLSKTTIQLKSAEADAERLADALKALGPERQGDGWHYFSCPTRHNLPDCDRKCELARAALCQHRELNA